MSYTLKIMNFILSGKNILILVLVVISFSSCMRVDSNSSVEFTKEYDKFRKEITSDESLVTLERTACFGLCPIYSLAIYEDGTLAYFGYSNVKETGLHYKTITKGSVNSLVSYALEMGYFNLLDHYEANVDTIDGIIYHLTSTDLPSEIISVRKNGKRKIVNNYIGGPNWLFYFENKIDSVTEINNWTKK